jgi:hypothetical protein
VGSAAVLKQEKGMKSMIYKTVVMTGLLVAMGSVQAEDDGLGIGVGARYSTLGAGIELGKSLGDHFGVRLGLNKYSKSDSQTIDDIDYDADLELSSTALLLDWHPFAGSFHLTAGYLNSSNKLKANASPVAGSSLAIGDGSYTVASTGDVVLNSDIKLGSGPYVGLGWGNVPAKGFGFIFEAGMVSMGTPDVSLSITGNDTATVNAINSSGDVQKEIANMEDDLDEFKTYPVIALGISYGF